ncbi:alanine racemase [Cognaticolwellia mytili]|uniref:alanine racemase n=1 Tax=Cognaticolwellia mytili TaxID=1888913 RepID=UPI000A17344D|nr:alanine racemase [Cognaticolwellia mytili]
MLALDKEITHTMYTQRSIITIDLAKLEYNFKQLNNKSGNADICAVVKADAYGHGAIKVAKKLQALKVCHFAVASVDEAIELRKSGIIKPTILLFGCDYIPHLSEVKRYNLLPVVYSIDNLKELIAHCSWDINVHLELDTGMSRTGLLNHELLQVIDLLKNANNIHLAGFFTHFSCADVPGSRVSQKQLMTFQSAQHLLHAHNLIPKTLHASNSAGFLTNSAMFDIVRTGLLLYGCSPMSSEISLDIKPILSWYTYPIQIKRLNKGEPVSYGSTWLAEKDSVIAIIPVGYADGYPRLASNKGFVLVDNVRANIVGNICMDFMMLDITECSNVTKNTKITLIGGDGEQNITLDDIATWSDTISYEVMCSIGKRCQYIYTDGEVE